MASDRQQFNRAFNKWQELHHSERYSASQSDGVIAVGYSRFSVQDLMSQQVREVAGFYDEATILCETAERKGRKARLYDGLTRASMANILLDEEVSDIVLIGHGSLSSIYLDNIEIYDWQDVSRQTTHLKQGVFIQRFCGNNLRSISIPLGTFSVSKHPHVIAPVDQSFDPNHEPGDEELLRPITDSSITSYDEAKRKFPVNPTWQRWVDRR